MLAGSHPRLGNIYWGWRLETVRGRRVEVGVGKGLREGEGEGEGPSSFSFRHFPIDKTVGVEERGEVRVRWGRALRGSGREGQRVRDSFKT